MSETSRNNSPIAVSFSAYPILIPDMMHLSRMIRTISPARSADVAAFSSSSSSFSSTDAEAAAAAGSSRLLRVGDVLRESRLFSCADVGVYSELSGDRNPAHLDDEFARSVAGFGGGRVVHGLLVASLFPSVIASHFPGAVYVSQSLQFKLPVYIGEEVFAEIQAINLREKRKRYMPCEVHHEMLYKWGIPCP